MVSGILIDQVLVADEIRGRLGLVFPLFGHTCDAVRAAAFVIG